MRTKLIVIPACLLFLLLFHFFEAAALWIEGGTLVDPGLETWHQNIESIALDGNGGAIISWERTYYGPGDVVDHLCQRIDSDGVVLWSSPILTSGGPFDSDLASDDSGGTFIIRNCCEYMGWWDAALDHIYADGSTQWIDFWTDPSYDECANISYDIIPDGSGGAILAWSGTFFNSFYGADIAGLFVVAQRIDAGDNLQWGDSGVYVCLNPEGNASPRIVPDGAGGAIIAWWDNRDSGDIYAQRIDGSGTALWTTDGVPVTTTGDPQVFIRMISDGSGGAIIVWEDDRNADRDIYAQRIDGSGVSLWTAGGVSVCSASGDQIEPCITSDGSEGAIISWCDPRSGTLDVYAQRIDASGAIPWASDGLAIADGTGDQRCCRIQEYGEGGAVIVYVDDSGADANIHAQHIDGAGTLQWGPTGIYVCEASGDQDDIVITTDGEGGAIIAWTDTRAWEWEAIYASRLTSPATGDDPEPRAIAALYQNHPNPFNPSTTIRYTLPEREAVTLEIFDVSGRLVIRLIDGELREAGPHSTIWSGCDGNGGRVESGLYFYRLTVGNETLSRKMLLLR